MLEFDVIVSYAELRTLIAGDVARDAEILTLRPDDEAQLVYLHMAPREVPVAPPVPTR